MYRCYYVLSGAHKHYKMVYSKEISVAKSKPSCSTVALEMIVNVQYMPKSSCIGSGSTPDSYQIQIISWCTCSYEIQIDWRCTYALCLCTNFYAHPLSIFDTIIEQHKYKWSAIHAKVGGGVIEAV